ncbi:hypothetical protein [Peptoniphilus genitalis]|uniref:hypothetical protein n=1 Tax=Peptoniphilus genitalis TaxID=3036303 RepID=UPI0024ADD5B4|nr:hypothetical protein [Peptoniphilus sp. Marseille-Q7072]
MNTKINFKALIFQDNKFSEAGLNEYIKNITKDNDIREDIISILTDENCNEYNLNLIKLSEKKSEAKHKYDGMNGILISMILFIGSFVMDLFLENSSSLSKFIILMVAEVLLFTILSINFKNFYKKPEEKRAEAYFWLESEMEKRIRELKKKDKKKDKKKNKKH